MTKIPLGNAHIAQAVSPGRILLMPQNWHQAWVVDEDHEHVATFDAPEGFHYSGHGLVLPGGEHLALPLCLKVRSDSGALGAVEVVSLRTWLREDLVQQWGFNPHELQYCEKRDEIVVADYGTLTRVARPLMGAFGKPAVFTCDPQTLAIRHVHDQAYSGAPTHLRVDSQGRNAFFILQQSAYVDVRPDVASYASAVKATESLVADLLDLSDRDYVVPYGDYGTPELSVPRPFVQLDLDTGRTTPLMTLPKHHLKPQSVELNAASGVVLASYTASDVLVAREVDGTVRVIDGAKIGITEIRGLADIPGTTLVAVAGSERNVSIFDLHADRPVAIFGTRNYVAPHLSYAPWRC